MPLRLRETKSPNMVDIGIISLVVSGAVALISLLTFVNTISAKRETDIGKLARSVDVDNQLVFVKKDVITIISKLEDHGQKISNLQVSYAVLSTQMTTQLKEVEKLSDKINDLGSWHDS